MPIGGRKRISVIEYGQPVDLVGQIAFAARIDRNKAWRMIDAT